MKDNYLMQAEVWLSETEKVLLEEEQRAAMKKEAKRIRRKAKTKDRNAFIDAFLQKVKEKATDG